MTRLNTMLTMGTQNGGPRCRGRALLASLLAFLLCWQIHLSYVANATFKKSDKQHPDQALLQSPSAPSNYPDDLVPKGLLSSVSVARLCSLQATVDEQDHTERCQRYGFVYNRTHPTNRRIFYGSNIAGESWELLEVLAAEAFGIMEGIVFVESNRTSSFMPRPFSRIKHEAVLRELFGSRLMQVRTFVNESANLRYLDRENAQRNEIIKGWKQMGMTRDDVGYVADLTETFSRDFLRAVQVCDGIEAFNYEAHGCGGGKTKLISMTRVFEMTPECVSDDLNWYHPDMLLGACIEMIGNEALNPIASRDGDRRTPGFGKSCGDWINATEGKYPLWNPTDFRMTCGGVQVAATVSDKYDRFTGYFFHNFDVDTPISSPKVEELSREMLFGIQCIRNITNDPRAPYKMVSGGFQALKPNLPLYFLDKEYRRQKHAEMHEKFQKVEIPTLSSNSEQLPESHEEIMQQVEVRKRPKRKSGTVYRCGLEIQTGRVAQYLFDDFLDDSILDQDSALPVFSCFNNYSASDILVLSLGLCGDCGDSPPHWFFRNVEWFHRNFSGKVLFQNAESWGDPTGENIFMISSQKQHHHNVQVTFAAMTLIGLLPRDKWPIMTWKDYPRPRNTGKYYLSYVTSNCVDYRQNIAMLLSQIGMIHHGSCVPPNVTTNSNFTAIPTNFSGHAKWTGNMELLRDFRFCLVLENNLLDGYITEKIVMAFMAGCVPIWYGTTEIWDIFNKNSFLYVDARNNQSVHELVETVRYLEGNDTAYHEIFRHPILADGNVTLEKYFSMDDSVGNGHIKHKIRVMMGLEDDQFRQIQL